MTTKAKKLPSAQLSDDETSQTCSKPMDTSGYQDYSREQHEQSAPDTNGGNRGSSTIKEPTFATKLHMILSNPDFHDIIAWLPHGRSWRILQQRVFEERVIPLYFRHGRYSSFARQVNGWGFRRVTHGSDYNSYYHEKFLRGMPHLCDRMRRLTGKDHLRRKKMGECPTPDFYRISQENPLPEDLNIQSKVMHSAANTAMNTTALNSVALTPSLAMHTAVPVSELPRADIQASVLNSSLGRATPNAHDVNRLRPTANLHTVDGLQALTASAALSLALPGNNIASQASLHHSLQQLKAASTAGDILYGPASAQSIQRQLSQALAAKAEMEALIGLVSRRNTRPFGHPGFPWLP